MTDKIVPLGKKIIAICEIRRIKKNKIAEQIGVTPQSVQKWKNGGSPSLDKIEEIASILDINVETLLEGTEFSDLSARLREEFQNKNSNFNSEKLPKKLAFSDFANHNNKLEFALANLKLDLKNKKFIWLYNQAFTISVDIDFFQKNEINEKNCKLMIANDSEMEPFIFKKDFFLIDITRTELLDGQFYVISKGSTYTIRQIFKQFNQIVSLRPSNPLFRENHLTSTEVEQLNVIGQVVYRVGSGFLA